MVRSKPGRGRPFTKVVGHRRLLKKIREPELTITELRRWEALEYCAFTPRSVAEMAEKQAISHGTMGKVISNLVAEGLLDLQPRDGLRREYLISEYGLIYLQKQNIMIVGRDADRKS